MYKCLSSDFKEVEKRIKSTIRLIEKYGYSAEYKVFCEEVKEIPVYKTDGIVKVQLGTTLAKVTNYDFKMPNFKVGNYIPVAIIEHDVVSNDDSATNMVHLINGFENAPKKWWIIPGRCDDCNDKYNRKKTVMLYDEENNIYRQVGTGCLSKYVGINCFNVIKNFMSVTEILEEELCVYGSSLPRENKYVNTERFLGLVIDEINLHGYIKGGITSHRAFTAINVDNKFPSQGASEKAKEIINFFKNVDTEDKAFTDFYMNIRSAVLSEYIGDSNLIGYAPLAYEKYKNILINRIKDEIRAANSEYVGNVGDKITISVEVIKCIGFDSNYGYSYINIFEEKDTRNIFVWITTTKALTIGQEYHIMGTIKAHKEYNGQKQTVLTRVKEV